jgi:hypothetical protein
MFVRTPCTWTSTAIGPTANEGSALSTLSLSSLHHDSREIPNSRLASLVMVSRVVRCPNQPRCHVAPLSHVTLRCDPAPPLHSALTKWLPYKGSHSAIASEGPLQHRIGAVSYSPLCRRCCRCLCSAGKCPPRALLLWAPCAAADGTTSLHSFKLQGHVTLKVHVAT